MFFVVAFSLLLNSSFGSGTLLIQSCNTSLNQNFENKVAKAEAEANISEKNWGTDNAWEESSTSYESYFNPLFPSKINTFEDWAKRRKAAKKNTHVLDLFGSGLFMSNFEDIDSITGMRLHYTETNKSIQKLKNDFEVIAGNLFYRETFEKLNESMRKRKIRTFDLITLRPVAGLWHLEKSLTRSEDALYRELFSAVIREAYHRLSHNGGEMYLEMPKLYSDYIPAMPDWVRNLNLNGIKARSTSQSRSPYESHCIQIIRNRNSPDEIPSL